MTKKKPLSLGSAGRNDVTVDGFELVDSRLLVVANSGGGKSYALRRIAEQVGDALPIIILDPEGEFATLRELLDMVLVGPGGEIPTDPRGAKLLARKLIELHLSAVVDLSDLSLSRRREFVRIFLESLLALPRKLWSPTLVILDEAHKFAPERGSGKSEATDAVISLMAQGRKRGFGGCLATQRLSKLHKDAVGEANNVMVGRCVQDVDIRRAADLLGLSRGDRDKLRSMKPGEFYGYGPAFGHDGIERFRTGKVSTTHPDARSRSKVRPTAPSARIQRVLGELRDLPAQEKKREDSLKEAKAKNRELEREIARLKSDQPDPEIDHEEMARQTTTKVNEAIQARDAEWRQVWRDRVGEALNGLKEVSDGLAMKPPQLAPPDIRTELPPRRSPRRARPSRAPRPAGGVEGPKHGARRKILIALAQYPDGLKRARIGALTGLKHGGGHFSNCLSDLRKAGWIEDLDDGVVRITDTGMQAAGDFEPLPEPGPELVEWWSGRLGDGLVGRLFDEVTDLYPNDIGRAELAEIVGVAAGGGHYSNCLSDLRRKGLITGSSEIRAADELFPDPR